MGLISEMVSANVVSQPDRSNWQKEEVDWFNSFSLSYDKIKQPPPTVGKKANIWKLRGTKEEITQWIHDQKRTILQFDGASKNNPGKAGVGGIIKDQHGKILVTYEWGLGQMSNNMAEAYSLFLGTSIMKQMQIQNPIIMGDSAIVIAAVATGGEFKKYALSNIKLQIMDNLIHLGDTTFKHVLRTNNMEADSFANRVVNRTIGQVRENDHIYVKSIP